MAETKTGLVINSVSDKNRIMVIVPGRAGIDEYLICTQGIVFKVLCQDIKTYMESYLINSTGYSIDLHIITVKDNCKKIEIGSRFSGTYSETKGNTINYVQKYINFIGNVNNCEIVYCS